MSPPVSVADEDEGHKKMEELLDSGARWTAAVTMHYPFPIGVSTVGRVVTPGKGKEMFIATTTGTSSTDRIEGMIKNADLRHHHRQGLRRQGPHRGHPERGRRPPDARGALNELWPRAAIAIHFAESARADGGCVHAGQRHARRAPPDVMVTDSLTGNMLIKMLFRLHHWRQL